MEFRSTNDVAYSHIKGDLVTNVSSGGVQNSSHGVHLTGGSTGGIVQAAGDETNIALTVRGKGAGPLTLGSSGAVILTGGSTAPFAGFMRVTDTAVATPNFATTNAMVMETTHTFTGISTLHFLIAQPHNLSTDCLLCQVFVGSTANEIHCRFAKVSTLTVGASTATISFLAIRF